MDQINQITQFHIPTAGQHGARKEKRAGSLEPAPHKRCRLALEVQLSEVSDETCDVAAYLCSVDQAAASAGGQAARQEPKASRLPGHQLSTAVGNNRSGTAQDPASAGPQATAEPQGCVGVSSSAMGPPAAPQTLPLMGSLLVAAQMAAGAAADGSSAGLVRGNSPLLLTTQATLQATTASVVAAEVLAAVNRPGGINSISVACAAPGVSAAALAGLLAGSLGTAGIAQHKGLTGLTSCPAGVPGPQTVPAQPQQTPSAATGATQGSNTPRAPKSKAPTDRPGAAEPSATAEDLASPQAAAAPVKLQVPSWLSETSPELKASQAICKASLDTATAALLRLSSPKALCPSSAAAAAAAPASAAAAGHTGAGALPLVAFAAGPPALETAGAAAPAASLAVPALWGPSLLPSSPAAAAPAAPAVPAAVFGIPARDVAAPGQGVAWGLPVGASAAAVAGSSTAALLSAQHQVAAAAAAANTLACLPPVTVGRAAHAAESDTADAASCCSSPKAAAAGAGAGDAATARLAAAALRLAAQSVEVQPGCVSGVCRPSSGALTADDASSPAASEGGDDAVSGLLRAGAAPKSLDGPGAAAAASAVDMEEEAAVVVHVEVTRSKGSAAAAAVKQLTQVCELGACLP